MRQLLIEYITAAVIFLAADFVWLRNMGPAFYTPELGGLLREEPQLGIALAFYLLFVAGLVLFVIHPGMQGEPLGLVAVKGAVFGLVAYATYDLTNLATVKGFTNKVAMVDMAWGTFISAAVCFITVWLLRRVLA
jgi:uncharacterized membrane protein